MKSIVTNTNSPDVYNITTSQSIPYLRTSPNTTASNYKFNHTNSSLRHTQLIKKKTKGRISPFYKPEHHDKSPNPNFNRLSAELETYVHSLKEKYHKYHKSTSPRKESIQQLLYSTNSDNEMMMTKLSFMKNTEDFDTLREIYSDGHYLGGQENKTKKYKEMRKDVYNKYSIGHKISKEQTRELIKLKDSQKIFSSRDVVIRSERYYRDQFQSLKKININKQLRNQIQLQLSTQQMKKYLNHETKVNQTKLKAHLMPHVRVVDNSQGHKSHSDDDTTINNGFSNRFSGYNSTNVVERKSKISDCYLSMNDLRKERDSIYTENNYFSMSYMDHLLIKPNSRTMSKMILYHYYGAKKLYLFGGIDTQRLNDLWECAISKAENKKVFKWKKIKDIQGDFAAARRGHTMCHYKNKLYIIGGDYQITQEDMLIYDIELNTYNSLRFKGMTNPGQRRDHIAECIGDFIVMYGGKDILTESVLDEIWAFDIIKQKWTQCTRLNGIQLPKLSSCASTLVLTDDNKTDPIFSFVNKGYASIHRDKALLNNNGIYIFGGYNEKGEATNKTYAIYLGKPLECAEVDAFGSIPPPRGDCTINFNEKLNGIILYGGKNNASQYNSFYRDIYILDLTILKWTKMSLTSGKIDKRGEHTSVMLDNDLIVFGGTNGKLFLKSDLLIIGLNVFANNKEAKRLEMKEKAIEKRNNKNSGTNVLSYPVNDSSTTQVHFLTQGNKASKISLNKKNVFQQSYLKAYMDKTKEIREKVDNIRKEHSEKYAIMKLPH